MKPFKQSEGTGKGKGGRGEGIERRNREIPPMERRKKILQHFLEDNVDSNVEDTVLI